MTQATAIATTIVEAQGITRDFQAGSATVHALRGIDLRIAAGEFVTLRGRSGSGKTTLLNILVGLDNPTQGRVSVLGQELSQMNEAARARLRRESIGILFQNAHLFPALTAQENIEIALRLLGVPGSERTNRAHETLELVGLSARTRHRAMELSGGEQQRVALARALVHKPRFFVADEPTRNLDSTPGQVLGGVWGDIVGETGIGLLVGTHDDMVMASAERVMQIHDGVTDGE